MTNFARRFPAGVLAMGWAFALAACTGSVGGAGPGLNADAGLSFDAGTPVDAGMPFDAGTLPYDAGPPTSLQAFTFEFDAGSAGTSVVSEATASGGSAVVLGSTGHAATFVVPSSLPAGRYSAHVRVRGAGWAGPDGETSPRIAFVLGSTDVSFARVSSRYERVCVGTVALVPGAQLSVRFLNDASGGSPATDRTVWVDQVFFNRQPDVNITGVSNGDLLAGTVAGLRATVGAGIVPSSVELTLEGSDGLAVVHAVRTAPPYCLEAASGASCASWDTTVLPDGDYALTVRATFAQGVEHLAAVAMVIANQHTSTWSAPLIVTTGGTYRGNFQSTDPRVPAVTIRTTDAVIIENSVLRGPGDLVSNGYWDASVRHYMINTRVTVRHTRGFGVTPATVRQKGAFVSIEEGATLTLENNSVYGVSKGLYVRSFNVGGQPGDGVRVLRNTFRNIDGRMADGQGGYLDRDTSWSNYPTQHYPGGATLTQFVQFNSLASQPNTEVAWNQIHNDPDVSRTEDLVNLYGSGGTASSRMRIHDNFLRGSFPLHIEHDAYSGGGILFGDGPGNEVRGSLDATNNQVVDTVNYGLGILGGQNSTITGNRVVSAGWVAGRWPVSQNVGLQFWDYGGGANASPPTFTNDLMADNVVGWQHPDGPTSRNDWWMPACALPSMTCTNNTPLGGANTLIPVDSAQTEFATWRTKVTSQAVQLGAHF